MAVNADSTDAQVIAAYENNASYDLNASIAECKEFIAACRLLLRRVPKRMRRGGVGGSNEIEIDPQIIRAELADALNYWRANDTTASAGGGGCVLAEKTDWGRG